MLTKSLAVAALAVVPALATPSVNVYWGQSGTDRLREYCENSSFEYVTVGFINKSPEQDDSSLEYPGSNFAFHCMNEYYQDSNGVNSNLLSKCGKLAADVRYCQKKGKKVLLSIGGTWNPPAADYTVSSPAKGEEFASFLWNAFGPYQASWGKRARPFDDYYGGPEDEADKHFVVDGFDFDIEHKFGEHAPSLSLPNCPDDANILSRRPKRVCRHGQQTS
jgi:chitinase